MSSLWPQWLFKATPSPTESSGLEVQPMIGEMDQACLTLAPKHDRAGTRCQPRSARPPNSDL